MVIYNIKCTLQLMLFTLQDVVRCEKALYLYLHKWKIWNTRWDRDDPRNEGLKLLRISFYQHSSMLIIMIFFSNAVFYFRLLFTNSLKPSQKQRRWSWSYEALSKVPMRVSSEVKYLLHFKLLVLPFYIIYR